MKDKAFITKILLIVLGAILVMGISGGAAYWAATAVIAKAGGGKATEAKKEDKEKKEAGVFLTVPEITTNLADPSGRRLIRVKIDLELSDDKAKAELEKKPAPMKEAILSVLRSKTVGDVNGAEGLEALTKELTKRISLLVTQGKLIQVYVTDMATQ